MSRTGRQLFRSALGVAAIAALWLTVVPVDGDLRLCQLVLAAVALAAVLVGSRWPMIAVIGTATSTAIAWIVGVTADPFVLTAYAVFLLAVQRGRRRFPLWLVGGAALVVTAALLVGEGGPGTGEVGPALRSALVCVILVGGAWVLGVQSADAASERAAAARTAERLRLSREVHDVLARSLGAIGVRAGVAAHVETLQPAELRTTLAGIEDDVRNSLTELSDLLRRERDLLPSGSALAELSSIVRGAEQAGLVVRADIDPDLDSLDTEIAFAVTRVVQEAVTNVIRHAGASQMSVVVAVAGEALALTVTDDGSGMAPGSAIGHGLTGVRERIALVGGSVDIVSRPGGVVVRATVPTSSSATSRAGVTQRTGGAP